MNPIVNPIDDSIVNSISSLVNPPTLSGVERVETNLGGPIDPQPGDFKAKPGTLDDPQVWTIRCLRPSRRHWIRNWGYTTTPSLHHLEFQAQPGTLDEPPS